LEKLLTVWQDYSATPPPLAPKTGLVWLEQKNNPKSNPQKVAQDTAKAYEGDAFSHGECAADPYLARAFADYAALTADGQFFALTDALLAPLWEITQ
jgi:exodeoxyribonuclease V gamma subunit